MYSLRRPQKLTKSSSSIWRLLHTVKLMVKILSIFVDFLENFTFNFNNIISLKWRWTCFWALAHSVFNGFRRPCCAPSAETYSPLMTKQKRQALLPTTSTMCLMILSIYGQHKSRPLLSFHFGLFLVILLDMTFVRLK